MSEDLVILALIKSYKQRGVDMSNMLDDPLFVALKPHEKIKAIQHHASEIQEGIDPTPKLSDASRILRNILVDGALGATTGAALGYHFGGGTEGLSRGALVGAGLAGLSGAIMGGMGAASDISHRRSLYSSLYAPKFIPTPENAVNVLSNPDTSAAGRLTKQRIIERIGTKVQGTLHGNIEPMVRAELIQPTK